MKITYRYVYYDDDDYYYLLHYLLLLPSSFLLVYSFYFRKHELYSMEWGGGINLGDFMVAAAPYGGPIALTRDETKYNKVARSGGKPIVFIFSSSGKKIASFKVSRACIIFNLQYFW